MSDLMYAYGEAIAQNWVFWLVTLFVIVAAVIDGFELRVPNKLTYPFIIAGWVYSTYHLGWEGLSWSLWGTFVGLMCLLPAYAIGGMGSGDVKMMMGIGAWIFGEDTMWSFGVSVTVGAVLAICMVLLSGSWKKHESQFWMILNEILTIRDPEKLTVIAAERKKSMMLLPYGIPIAIGTILYFMWMGKLV